MEENFRFESVNGLAKALGGRIDLLEKIFGKKVRDNLKYSDIQKIVKSGFASEFFDLGDEIMTKYTTTDGTVYDFPWRIVDFRDVYWENDPNPHPGMVLQGKYATAEQLAYDADDADWSHSSIRQWLNSDAEQGNWWTSTYDGDTTPTELNTYNGFMYGLDEEFLNSLKATKLTTYITTTFGGDGPETIDTYDKFFIASVAEMYGYPNKLYAVYNEVPFKYWINVVGTKTGTNANINARKTYSVDNLDTPQYISLRTYLPMMSPKNIVYLDINGSTTNSATSNAPRHVLPVCVIS